MGEEQKEAEYREAVHNFYEIYRPLQKKYNLRMHAHFSIYDDGLIEIWEYNGEARGKCILKVQEEKDIDCYKRAAEYLKSYEKSGKEREKQWQHGTKAG